MADKPLSNTNYSERMTFLLVGLFLLAAIINSFLAYVDSLTGGTGTFWSALLDYFLTKIWPLWKLIALVLSFFAFVGIIHSYRKMGQINQEEQKIYGDVPESTVLEKLEAVEEIVAPKPENEQWKKILVHINSDNPAEWRHAIIEADVMLEELLRMQGLFGDSVGEMLKSADKNQFNTLEEAWEAHKVRNAIAHSGSNFQLTQREAKRVIALFEKVFQEFGIV